MLLFFFVTESTCSQESCYGCITNSESSEEFQKSGLDTTEVPIHGNNLDSQLKTTKKRNLKNVYETRSDTLTRVLKVSHFSKSLLDNTDLESKPLETDEKFEYMATRASKSRHEKPFEPSQRLSKSPQILRVVDVVPKPKFPPHTFDHHVLDQTIGIPLKNVSHIRSCSNTLLNSNIHSNSYIFPKTLPNAVHERFFISDKLTNDTRYEPQIIHHPLISGNIPFNNIHETHKKILNQESKALLPTKSFSHESGNVVLATNRNVSSQQTTSTKRENGERNKVKFCNTVTVAMVPVSFQTREFFT